jgi:predicted alpha/beta superfamily hydrolase
MQHPNKKTNVPENHNGRYGKSESENGIVFLEAHGGNGAALRKRRIGLAAAPILYDAPDDCPAARLAHLIEPRRIATVAGVRRASETLSSFSPGSKFILASAAMSRIVPISLLCLSSLIAVPAFARSESSSMSSSQAAIASGAMEKFASFQSKFVAPRNVDVWLPPGYAAGGQERFPVLYMHDGQNLFDPKTAYAGVEWGVDETMTHLIAEGNIRPAIVVGVWNTPKRAAEYMPQKATTLTNAKDLAVSAPLNTPIISDDYLKFLVQELKPFIDAKYRTLPGRADTFIMGSSMGGLISAYAMAEYPDVFGGAGCVSTHWPAGNGSVIEYLKTHMPAPGAHKFYFDYGTETLDAQYEPYQQKMDAVMKSAGYAEGKNWVTRKFEGDEHSEKSWRRRVDVPLTFFLGRDK